ncbi:MAG: hypothetical protein AAF447_05505 [Myxococcota bacterium]
MSLRTYGSVRYVLAKQIDLALHGGATPFGQLRLRVPGNDETLRLLMGPGYFVVRPHHVAGELAIDYRELPEAPAPGWPPIRGNDARLSRFVYAGTVDVLRGVSAHVTVGRASRDGRFLPAWFVLCREVQ